MLDVIYYGLAPSVAVLAITLSLIFRFPYAAIIFRSAGVLIILGHALVLVYFGLAMSSRNAGLAPRNIAFQKVPYKDAWEDGKEAVQRKVNSNLENLSIHLLCLALLGIVSTGVGVRSVTPKSQGSLTPPPLDTDTEDKTGEQTRDSTTTSDPAQGGTDSRDE